jgi:hypothetical protein
MNTKTSPRGLEHGVGWTPYLLAAKRAEMLPDAFALAKELVGLIARPGYEHVFRDSLADLASLARSARRLTRPPDLVICLDDSLRGFTTSLFRGATVHDFDLTRTRNMLAPDMRTAEFSVTNGEVDQLRRDIEGGAKVGVIDTVCLTGGTAIKTAEILGIKNPVFIMIGVTRDGLDLLSKKGSVIYGFETDHGLYPVHKLLKNTVTRTGVIIPADQLIELLHPVLTGDQKLSDFFEKHNISPLMSHPNLFLNAFEGGKMSMIISPKKVAANATPVRRILRDLIDMQEGSTGPPLIVTQSIAKGELKGINSLAAAVKATRRPDEMVGPVPLN